MHTARSRTHTYNVSVTYTAVCIRKVGDAQGRHNLSLGRTACAKLRTCAHTHARARAHTTLVNAKHNTMQHTRLNALVCSDVTVAVNALADVGLRIDNALIQLRVRTVSLAFPLLSRLLFPYRLDARTARGTRHCRRIRRRRTNTQRHVEEHASTASALALCARVMTKLRRCTPAYNACATRRTYSTVHVPTATLTSQACVAVCERGALRRSAWHARCCRRDLQRMRVTVNTTHCTVTHNTGVVMQLTWLAHVLVAAQNSHCAAVHEKQSGSCDRHFKTHNARHTHRDNMTSRTITHMSGIGGVANERVGSVIGGTVISMPVCVGGSVGMGGSAPLAGNATVGDVPMLGAKSSPIPSSCVQSVLSRDHARGDQQQHQYRSLHTAAHLVRSTIRTEVHSPRFACGHLRNTNQCTYVLSEHTSHLKNPPPTHLHIS
jgi:hypothetical protein